MKKLNYYVFIPNLKTQFVCILICLLCFAPAANAKWELVKELKSANALLITEKGTMLISDLVIAGVGEGGIWRSEDKGVTWTKCDVPSNNYGIFYETGKYIFAGGSGCRIARSADDGKTWEILRYDNVVEDLLDKPGMAEQAGGLYTMLYFDNKLYLADFGIGVVLYSENFGEKWDLTDTKSLRTVEGANDSFYHLQEYKGELYAFGAYCVYKMNKEDFTWEIMRNSNFLITAIEYNGKLIAGHGRQDMTDGAENIVYTENGKDWKNFPCPADIVDNAVRVLATDGMGIYVGSQNCGVFFSADEGKNWKKLDDGYPKFMDVIYFVPMKFDFTEEDVYVSLWEMDAPSGLYKMSKSEFTGIQSIRNDGGVKIYTEDNSSLYVAIQDQSNFTINIVDAYGKTVYHSTNQNCIDIKSFASGIYICQVNINGITYTNKLVKN